MRFRRWQIVIAATLLALAVLGYAARWELFSRPALHNEMLRYLVDDIAFLFIQVLLVSLLLDGLIQRRAREAMLNKLNMIIGAFFSECGTDLLERLAQVDRQLSEVRSDLVPTATWSEQDYERAKRAFREHRPVIDLGGCDLAELRRRLDREKPYFLGLLGNQALLEHETFTDLLWAVTHLAEELSARDDLSALPPPDVSHLAADAQRAYTLLGVQWLDYLLHLQTKYPYLFSLALRTNPLDPEASVVLTT